jgi:hypothetical protein
VAKDQAGAEEPRQQAPPARGPARCLQREQPQDEIGRQCRLGDDRQPQRQQAAGAPQEGAVAEGAVIGGAEVARGDEVSLGIPECHRELVERGRGKATGEEEQPEHDPRPGYGI